MPAPKALSHYITVFFFLSIAQTFVRCFWQISGSGDNAIFISMFQLIAAQS
jgi:hypothetical protein